MAVLSFFIANGGYTARKKRGRVADFCPFCRQVQPFHVLTVEHNEVVQGLDLGSEPPSWEVVCTACGMPIWRDYSPYACYSTERRQSTADLLAHTHPRFEKLHAARADVEARLMQQALHPDERAALLREPFLIGEQTIYWYDALRPGFEHYRRVFLAGVAATAVPALVAAGYRWPIWVAMLPWFAAVLYIVISLVRRPSTARRRARRALLPAIARALRPLRPTHQELQEIFDELRTERCRLADYLSASDVDEHLRRG